MIVRATFTIPKDESDSIQDLRLKFSKRGIMLNKSEVIRAGLAALESLPEDQLPAVAHTIRKLQPGKPRVIGRQSTK